MICNSYSSCNDRMWNKLHQVTAEKQKKMITVALVSVLKLTIYDVFIVWLFLCHFKFKQKKSATSYSMSKPFTVCSCKPLSNRRYFTCWNIWFTGRKNRYDNDRDESKWLCHLTGFKALWKLVLLMLIHSLSFLYHFRVKSLQMWHKINVTSSRPCLIALSISNGGEGIESARLSKIYVRCGCSCDLIWLGDWKIRQI